MSSPASALDDLAVESRAGVPHYAVGQHRAWHDAEEPDAAVLLYVDAMGWAVIVGCVRECDWEPAVILGRVSATGVAQRGAALPEGFVLSDESRAALASATAM